MRIAVIGAGFSGLLTAVHLLRLSPTAHINLIERGPAFGPGTAYSTTNPDHVLNVRLTNMSAFPDQPSDLLNWLSQQDGWRATDQFITRGMYGRYLRSLMQTACGSDRRLRQVSDEVVDVERVADGWRVKLASGERLVADVVVLALGVMEPGAPVGAGAEMLGSPRYVANPWAPGAALPEDAQHVLLLGTGLTMVDVAIGMGRPGRRFTALSRRGLIPRGHGPATPAIWTAPQENTPRAILSAARRQAVETDWRSVMDGLRTQARALWRDWSPRQRQQFLRHLRPWWDVHRHRLAPAVHTRVHGQVADGTLSVIAGRTLLFKVNAEGVEVAWRERGDRKRRRLRVDAVVNCTGPIGSSNFSTNGLVRKLHERGLMRADAEGVGADVDATCRLIDWQKRPQPGLFAVGPLTRGAFWEMTSVPDLRQQALDVARFIVTEQGGRHMDKEEATLPVPTQGAHDQGLSRSHSRP